jgi:hypothetical protein
VRKKTGSERENDEWRMERSVKVREIERESGREGENCAFQQSPELETGGHLL